MDFLHSHHQNLKIKEHKLKSDLLKVQEQIVCIEYLNESVSNFGIVGDFDSPSLEDDGGCTQEFDAWLMTDLTDTIKLKYNRLYIGFPELNEYDSMTEFVLPRYYQFKYYMDDKI